MPGYTLLVSVFQLAEPAAMRYAFHGIGVRVITRNLIATDLPPAGDVVILMCVVPSLILRSKYQ